MLAEQGIHTPLAIVGSGASFRAGPITRKATGNLLCSETDATCTVPETRWNAAKYHDPNPAKVGKMVTSRGGFLRRSINSTRNFSGSRRERRTYSIRSSAFCYGPPGRRWKTAEFPPKPGRH